MRSADWRYIRYADGSEELYDHRRDPNEWTNLAGKPELDSVKKDLARWMPKENKQSADGKNRQRKAAKAK